jgi:hypothetical protein
MVMEQGCQMAYFQTKNLDLGKFWRKMLVYILCAELVYFMAVWYTHFMVSYFVYFSPFWYVVPRKIWRPCYGMRPRMVDK